jgi:5-methylthioadenosine/S-adenosylhomocysteine deaminase
MAIVIKGGYLLDAERPFAVGDVVIEGDEIVEVGESAERAGATVLDARGKIVMPGLVNAHTHSNQAIEKGLCDRLPLDSWMVLASYGGAGTRLEPQDLYISAMLGAIEMLSTGTTSVIDCMRTDIAWFDEGMDAVMQAYSDIGMRANVAAQFADLDFFSSIPLSLIEAPAALREERRRASVGDILTRAEHYIDRWSLKNPRLTPMLGPSSVARCSRELYSETIRLVKHKKTRLQSHLLSAKSQVPVAEELFGGSTVRYLESLGALGPWASYAHGIWIADDEIPVLAESESVIVHNPVSNQKLGAGIAPVPALDRAHVNVALGSDGASSGDSQNMFEVMKSAALLHRIANPPEHWLGSADSLRMCWHGGSAAMGAQIGRLSPGYKADLTILKTGELMVGPKEQTMNALVYSEVGRSVETVIVGGQIVVDGGKVITVDVGKILEEAQNLTARIWTGLPERLQAFEKLRPILEDLERTVGRLPLAFNRLCG